VQSAGGCSLPGEATQISHVRFSENYWDRAEPFWGCNAPTDIELGENTVLPADTAAEACRGDRECLAIVKNAGLERKYRSLLDDRPQS
jgi:hypothetical protein